MICVVCHLSYTEGDKYGETRSQFINRLRISMQIYISDDIIKESRTRIENRFTHQVL